MRDVSYGIAGATGGGDPLKELEARIRARRRWRGRAVFYQVLEAELEPLLASAVDPAAVRARVRGMLQRLGHAPDPPPVAGVAGDAAHLCVVPERR